MSYFNKEKKEIFEKKVKRVNDYGEFHFRIKMEYDYTDESNLIMYIYQINNVQTGAETLVSQSELKDFLPFESVYVKDSTTDVKPYMLANTIEQQLEMIMSKQENTEFEKELVNEALDMLLTEKEHKGE